ncbi:aminodeoxychorismate synthase component I [Colwellia sp. MEBiC06753]
MIAKPISFGDNTLHSDIFSQFADIPWSFWLDSNESSHVDSRYDIMVWQPAITIETTEHHSLVTAIKPEFEHLTGKFNSDPLALLKSIEQQVFGAFALPDCELPFKSGAIGYFSYDLGRCFEKLPAQAQDDISLPLMAVGIYLQALIFDRKTKSYTLIAPELEWQDSAELLCSNVKSPQEKFCLTSSWQSNMTKSQYQQKFNQVQHYLLEGDCYQINLAQRFQATYQGDEFSAYLTLRAANQAPFSAFMRFAQFAIVSISPERFLQVVNGNVQTKPIKGTKPRHDDALIDIENATALKNSTKDRAENLMIVDLLRNDLSKVCKAGTVKVPKLFDIESFPAVHHLVSTVEGQLKTEFDGTDLLRASFPGGSITGAPKIRAMDIIEELEPHRRNLYCGSIGYLSACGNMDTSITIRTLICQNQQMYCWAGGGLVADSKVDSEYQETFDKVNKILPILANK